MKKIYLIVFIFISTYSYAQLTKHSYVFDGNKREFNIYLPSSYETNKDKLPVVLFLHGMGGNMNNFSGLKYKAEAEKYIMLVPQALSDPNFGTTWHSGAGKLGIYPNKNIDDVAFISSLIDTVSKWYNVDQNRIYSTGFSMGGFMTNRLACELNNKIAAFASVAGTIGNEIKNTCKPDKIIPILNIHSTTDKTIPYYNNEFGIETETFMQFWLKNNNFKGQMDTINMSKISNDGFSTLKYSFKRKGSSINELVFYRLTGPSHNESFFNATSDNDFDAIDVIWDFFKKHKNSSEINNSNAEQRIITNINQAKFDVFPNPASQKITLNFESKVELTSVSIANTLGKVIDFKTYEKPINESVFDISDKAPGIYFFQIKDIEGNLTVMRFYKK
ncbi:MAG: T9SS type A sorting domain-containing protein [Chitinophagales bacterium]